MAKKKSIAKEIKSNVFSCNPDYDVIYDHLNESFEESLSAILNSILSIFRDINKGKKSGEKKEYEEETDINNEIISNLVECLNVYIEEHRNKNVLNKMHDKIDIFLSNLSKSFNWKELMNIEKYISILVSVQNKCLITGNSKGKGDKYNFIMYLVFKKKDIELLSKYLFNNMNELIISNNILPSVFAHIIEKYISIDEDNEDSKHEIKYFNQVIYLFLRGKLGDKLLSNKDYINVLKTSNKSFVWDLIYKIENDFVMSREEVANAYGVSFYFPPFKEKYEYVDGNTKDYTKQEVLTIDNDGDTCLDDGLFIKKRSNGTYRLYIHLANVPEIIPYTSNIMREALKRQKTIYLPGTTIPIFEEYLSSGILSLLPNKVTNTLTFRVDVDTDYSLLLDTLTIIPGRIISKHKLSYEEADDILKKANTPLSEIINLLLEVFNKLSRDNLRVKSFHKFKNILSQRNDTNSFKSDTSPAHLIVEHSMVLSGRFIPMMNKYHNLNLLMPWRVCPKFDEEYAKKVLDEIDNVDISGDAFKRVARDYFPKSYYSFENIGHAGLGIDGYVKVGSSARDAMNALAEYIIYDLIINRNAGDLDYKYYFWEKEIKYWCEYANNKIAENNSFAEEYSYLKRNGKILELEKK